MIGLKISAVGTPKTSQLRKAIVRPASSSRTCVKMRFGGVPMSVATPPIEAP